MNIHLHANATTTPKIRRYIQASNQPVTQLADELGVSADTIRRWRGRDWVADGSHTPHRLQTTLTPAQEAVVVELRKTLLLPLDDLLAVTRSSTPIFPDPLSTAVCAAMGSPTSRPCCRQRTACRPPRTRPSRITHRASCTSL